VSFYVGNRGCYACKVIVSLNIRSENHGYEVLSLSLSLSLSLNDGVILFDEVGPRIEVSVRDLSILELITLTCMPHTQTSKWQCLAWWSRFVVEHL